jgi:ABC-2 type transport system ATP-binding protein
MAFITEEGSYMPYMTPVAYGEFLADFFPRFDKTRYMELLAFYEIPLDRKLRTFSKGQKLKVEISAGLAKSARLIVMDEPFQGKDLLSRQAFIQLAVAQLQDDQTLVIATHLIGDIDNLIDRAIILHNGQLVADVQIDELREQGRTLPELLTEAAGGKERRPFSGMEDDK